MTSTESESPAELLPEDVLPCDVQVAPRTIIRRGCKVSTLLHCLALRVGRRDIGPLLPLKPAPVASESRGSVPDGFVLVPCEATSEMIRACENQWLAGSAADMARREWRAMLAAAPTPPAVSNGEPTAEQWKRAWELEQGESVFSAMTFERIEQRARELARSAAAKGEG